jgi:ABC-type phosphate transport system ATPase subunit
LELPVSGLANQPEAILLEKPTSGLDPISTGKVWTALQEEMIETAKGKELFAHLRSIAQKTTLKDGLGNL